MYEKINTAKQKTSASKTCMLAEPLFFGPKQPVSQQSFFIQRAVHQGTANFPDSENCWATPGNKPDLTKTVAIIEAVMTIPDTCSGDAVLRTTLTDVTSRGATGWASQIKFGSSDGTEFGSLKSPSGITETTVYFEEKIPLANCTLNTERYHYIRLVPTKITFVEVAYKPSVSPGTTGNVSDASTAPALRVEPCGGLQPGKETPPPMPVEDSPLRAGPPVPTP